MPCDETAAVLTVQSAQIDPGVVSPHLSVNQGSPRGQLLFSIIGGKQFIHRSVCLPRRIAQYQRVRPCTSQQLTSRPLHKGGAEDLCAGSFRQYTQFEVTKDFV